MRFGRKMQAGRFDGLYFEGEDAAGGGTGAGGDKPSEQPDLAPEDATKPDESAVKANDVAKLQKELADATGRAEKAERAHQELANTHKGTAQERERLAQYLPKDVLDKVTKARIDPASLQRAITEAAEEALREDTERKDVEADKPLTRREWERLETEKARGTESRLVNAAAEAVDDLEARVDFRGAVWARLGAMGYTGDGNHADERAVAQAAEAVRKRFFPAKAEDAKPVDTGPSATEEEAKRSSGGPRSTAAGKGAPANKQYEELKAQIKKAAVDGDMEAMGRYDKQLRELNRPGSTKDG